MKEKPTARRRHQSRSRWPTAPDRAHHHIEGGVSAEQWPRTRRRKEGPEVCRAPLAVRAAKKKFTATSDLMSKGGSCTPRVHSVQTAAGSLSPADDCAPPLTSRSLLSIDTVCAGNLVYLRALTRACCECSQRKSERAHTVPKQYIAQRVGTRY